jgi:hypothetical protein
MVLLKISLFVPLFLALFLLLFGKEKILFRKVYEQQSN